VQDDLSITIEDDAALEANLRVFKEIFQKSQHGAHYEMMMNGSV
jgi:wobble nucleotide-excising tRNase